MKNIRTIVLVVIAIFLSIASISAQELETKATQNFTVNGTGWSKIFRYGDPVTIFAYKQKSDVYTFGIYSDDYAGLINMKNVPFDVQTKQLKKLTNAQGKEASNRLNYYFNKACANARQKALAGKYRTTAPYSLVSGWGGYSVLKDEPITIIGYKGLRDNVGPVHYFAIIKSDDARIYHSILDDGIVKDIPLSFLPSTDDTQVKSIIEKERSRIVAERQAKEEKERRLAVEKKAQEKKERAELKAMQDSVQAEIEIEKLENLRRLSPAFINISGWNMDSAGGNEVNISFTNCSSQTVKYVYFRGYFLNAVGDRCRNEVGGSTEWKYRGVGPISPLPKTPDEDNYNYIEYWRFGNPRFYSTIADKFRLSSVTIEYMNGKKITLSGAELKKRVKYPY